MAAEGKIQRSFYFTPDQAKWLKVQSAKTNVSASAILGALIDTARFPSVKTTTPEDIKVQGQNIHNILSKIAKQ